MAIINSVKKPGLIPDLQGVQDQPSNANQALDNTADRMAPERSVKGPSEPVRVGPTLATPTPPSIGSAPVSAPPTTPNPPPPNGGMINTTPSTVPTGAPPATGIVAAAQSADPSSIVPVQRTVTNDELVEQRLANLLGSDSPLIARARQRAAENATARGLQNSSMAVQSGEAAAIDAALPIATADANTYSRQGLTNQDATNQFLSQDKTLAGQEKLAGADRLFQGGENDKNRATQTGIASMNASTQASIAAADRDARTTIATQEFQQRLELAGMDAKVRTELSKMDIDARTASNITNLQQNSLVNFSQGFTAIQSSSMEPDAKDNATKNYLAIWAGSPWLPVGIDLTKLPSTTSPPPVSGT